MNGKSEWQPVVVKSPGLQSRSVCSSSESRHSYLQSWPVLCVWMDLNVQLIWSSVSPKGHMSVCCLSASTVCHSPPESHSVTHASFRVTPGVQSRLFWSVVPWWRNKLPESVRTARPLLSSGISWKLISAQTCLTTTYSALTLHLHKIIIWQFLYWLSIYTVVPTALQFPEVPYW